jgi:prepilin-type N-terminal cleavage/methylation domain-containing protein
MTAVRHPTTAGFSLIELLIVIGMLGLVTGAIYSTYLSQQRNAYSQGEVTEVQQNLRVAMDYLARDLKMAGALTPAGTPPLAAPAGSPPFPNYSTSIVCNTASAEGRFARVDLGNTVSSGELSIQLTLEPPANASSANCVDALRVGDRLRLIRPVDGSQPLSGTRVLVVSNIAGNPQRGDPGRTPPIPPTITLNKCDGTAFGDDVIAPNDLLAKVADATTFPMTVAYFLVGSGTAVNGFSCPANQRCLVRQVNGDPLQSDIVATNLSSLKFSYLDDSYHEARVPGSLASVRAVRISLQGATARTSALSGGARIREVTTVVKLRNRR